jgi:hypothetical protein
VVSEPELTNARDSLRVLGAEDPRSRLRRRAAEHRGLDRFLRAEGVPLRLRLGCHVHVAVARLVPPAVRGRRPEASRIGEWDARRRDDA